MNRIRGLVNQINVYKKEMRKTLKKEDLTVLEMHNLLFDLKDLNELVDGLRMMSEQACITDFKIMVSENKSYEAIDMFMRALSYRHKDFSNHWRNLVTDVNVREGHFTIQNMHEQFRVSLTFVEKCIDHIEEKQTALAKAVDAHGKTELAKILQELEYKG